MDEINEQLERLISRKLDGELTDEESLALDKLLIREPQARALLEQSQRIDDLAGQVFRDAICDQPTAVPNEPLPLPQRRSLAWLLWPSTAAACLVLVLSYADFAERVDQALFPQTQSPLVTGTEDSLPNPTVRDGHFLSKPSDRPAIRPTYVSDRPGVRRSLNENMNYYGVYDEASGRLYWLEVKETNQGLRHDKWSAPARSNGPMLTSGRM